MIIKASPESISRAANHIRDGRLVAFPTETVYGLGANALDPKAVAGIFAMKQRPSFDPLIVHICRLDQLWELVTSRDERIIRLARHFWPGPLTLVLPKSQLVPDIVTSGLPDVAIRMPANDTALQLIEAAGVPLAAPSANRFGRLSPTRAQHVEKQLPDLEIILDGGSCSIGLESSVVRLEPDGFRILRHGAVTSPMLTEIIPPSKLTTSLTLSDASPGLMLSHYSPETKLYILGQHPIPNDTSKAAYVGLTPSEIKGYHSVRFLSENGNLEEAAGNLFFFLHELEDKGLDFIVVEAVPETGLGIAIMDRLRKAAYRFHHSTNE